MHTQMGKRGESRLVSEATALALRTPRMVVPDSESSPLHASSFPELGPTSYGLGFFITTYRGHKLVWHSGSLDGYSLLFSFLPREKLGVLVLTNLSGNRPVPVCVTRNVFDRLLGLEPIDWVARCKTLDQKADPRRSSGPAQDRGRAQDRDASFARPGRVQRHLRAPGLRLARDPERAGRRAPAGLARGIVPALALSTTTSSRPTSTRTRPTTTRAKIRVTLPLQRRGKRGPAHDAAGAQGRRDRLQTARRDGSQAATARRTTC